MLKAAMTRREEALQKVAMMKETGEKISALSFGDGDSMFISSDENLIRGIDVVEVDGEFYFIGFKK